MTYRQKRCWLLIWLNLNLARNESGRLILRKVEVQSEKMKATTRAFSWSSIELYLFQFTATPYHITLQNQRHVITRKAARCRSNAMERIFSIFKRKAMK